MKISYRQEIRSSYLMIDSKEDTVCCYETKMMLNNQIDGLLKVYIKQTDNQFSHCYDITSLQPLNSFLEEKGINGKELKILVFKIYSILEQLELYLISETGLLLEPEYIYVNPENFQIKFCLFPERNEPIFSSISGLFRYLIKKTDHKDKECTALAYGLYHESIKEYFGMNNLLEFIELQKKQNMEKQEEEEVKSVKKQNQENYLTDSKEDLKKTPVLRRWFTIAALTVGVAMILIKEIDGVVFLFLVVAIVVSLVYLVYSFIKCRISLDLIKKPVTKKVSYTKEEDQWNMIFGNNRESDEKENKSLKEWDYNTKLLSDRYLKSTTPLADNIPVPYVPFIIGKQEGLADYILNNEVVSRLHVRIDKKGEDYEITDLNSKNGTIVCGKRLEANVAEPLYTGNEIYIANLGFIFT